MCFFFTVDQVTMADRLAAERACKDANPIIDGRKANVNLAYLGAKPRGNIQTGNIINKHAQQNQNELSIIAYIKYTTTLPTFA